MAGAFLGGFFSFVCIHMQQPGESGVVKDGLNRNVLNRTVVYVSWTTSVLIVVLASECSLRTRIWDGVQWTGHREA